MLIPRFLWNIYVSNRDSEKMSLKLQNNYIDKQGFPWTDFHSKKDWDEIKNVLNRHSKLY